MASFLTIRINATKADTKCPTVQLFAIIIPSQKGTSGTRHLNLLFIKCELYTVNHGKNPVSQTAQQKLVSSLMPNTWQVIPILIPILISILCENDVVNYCSYTFLSTALPVIQQ